jgi:hypothetical protein
LDRELTTLHPKEAECEEILNRALDLKQVLWNDLSNGKWK